MQRKFEVKTRGRLFIEHLVWNAAAGAALAVMVLVLLCAVQWLDQIAPIPAATDRGMDDPTPLAQPRAILDLEPTKIAAVNGPDG